MSKLGNLKEVSGKVYAQDPQGNMREVQPGDAIYEGEMTVNESGVIMSDVIYLASAEQTGFSSQSPEAKVQIADNNADKVEKPVESHYLESSTSTDDITKTTDDTVNISASLHGADDIPVQVNTVKDTGGAIGISPLIQPLEAGAEGAVSLSAVAAESLTQESNMQGSVTLKLLAVDKDGNEIGESCMYEGGMTYYKVVLLDSNGNEIPNATGSVDIVFLDDTAVRTGTIADGTCDFVAHNQTVQLNVVFSAHAFDDMAIEGCEQFAVEIVDGSFSTPLAYSVVTYNPAQVCTAIQDCPPPVCDPDTSPKIIPDDMYPGGAGHAIVYEEGLFDGTNSASDKEFANGTIKIIAEDGLSKVTIGGTSITEAALLASSGTPVTIATKYGELTINGFTPTDSSHKDGSGTIHYTYALTDNTTDHSASGKDEVTDSIPLSITDKDGDVGNGTFDVTVVDDVPSITVSKTGDPADILTVDETDLTTDATASFADNFTNLPISGADGATVTSAYTLSVASGSTGLVDTATGQDVVLSMNGTAVEGKNTDGNIVFTLTTDASGNVTLDQQRAVVHPVPGDGTTPPDSHDEPISLDSDLITLTREDTITDGDGDTSTASDTIGLGTNLIFKDDGPTAGVPEQGTAEAELDETGGLDAVTIDAADITDLFDGSDAYGEDGAGDVAYSLDAGTNTSTGLYLTGDPGGDEIILHSTATGYAGKTGAGTVAFTVDINSTTGAVTVTQKETLDHPIDTDPNDALTLSTQIKVVQTVTDGDDDTAIATSANALDITFLDDGPTAGVPEQGTAEAELDETGGLDAVTIDAADITDLFDGSDAYGEDGAGDVAYSLDAGTNTSTGLYLTGDPGGDEIILHSTATGYAGKTGAGTVAFTVDINSTTGAVTVTQKETLDHPIVSAVSSLTVPCVSVGPSSRKVISSALALVTIAVSSSPSVTVCTTLI